MYEPRQKKPKSRLKWAAILLGPFIIGFFLFKPGSKPTSEEKNVIKSEVPKQEDTLKREEEKKLSPQGLVAAGELIIFGTDAPKLNASGRLPVGKGQCAFCHIFVEKQKSDRCPSLRNIQKRSHDRINEARYLTKREGTSLNPHAKTGGEYLIESLYCPSCYIVEGFAKEGSHGQESRMPFVTEMPMMLNDYEAVAVVSYLQDMEAPGDYSKITAKADWENYFKRTLKIGPDRRPSVVSTEDLTKTALLTDTPEIMIEKMSCFVCHKIPTVPVATIGLLGPALTLKNDAALRVNSAEYQLAVKEGRAHATTPQEYVLESILDPQAFVPPEFTSREGMPTNYNEKFTVGALNKLVDFLLTLDENSGKEDDSGKEENSDREEAFDRDETLAAPESKKTGSASKRD